MGTPCLLPPAKKGFIVFQFGPEVDKRLDELNETVTVSEDTIEMATANKDKAWDEVLGVFDEFARDGKEARFIASNGRTLARTKRQGSPKLDENKLYELLRTTYGATKADRIWKSITKCVVDSRLLEIAVQDHKVDAELVESCITTPEPTFIRLHPEWTKEDKERLALFE